MKYNVGVKIVRSVYHDNQKTVWYVWTGSQCREICDATSRYSAVRIAKAMNKLYGKTKA